MTNFFTDNFESGDLTAWTTAQGNPTVQTMPIRNGQYAVSMSITSLYRKNYISKTYSSLTGVYLRLYIYFSSLPPANTEVLVARCAFSGSRPLVIVVNNGSAIGFFFFWVILRFNSLATNLFSPDLFLFCNNKKCLFNKPIIKIRIEKAIQIKVYIKNWP